MYFCTFLNCAPSWFLQRFLYLPYTRFMAPLRFQVYAPFLTRYFGLLWYHISGPILYQIYATYWHKISACFCNSQIPSFCTLSGTRFLYFPDTRFLHLADAWFLYLPDTKFLHRTIIRYLHLSDTRFLYLILDFCTLWYQNYSTSESKMYTSGYQFLRLPGSRFLYPFKPDFCDNRFMHPSLAVDFQISLIAVPFSCRILQLSDISGLTSLTFLKFFTIPHQRPKVLKHPFCCSQISDCTVQLPADFSTSLTSDYHTFWTSGWCISLYDTTL